MSRPNRRDIVDPNEVGVYHCYSRCVQGSYLCGYDDETKKDYSHRKQWIEDRQILLASVFAMELLGYAILDNHMHHVIRTCPDVARTWSSEEVVKRWWALHPRKDGKGRELELTEELLRDIMQDEELVAKWRGRLASLSWYMKELKEEIAKRANRESGARGHFWEARFSSPRLADVISLLLCLMYVDLNAVRAGIAETPEQSRYTSFWRRTLARQVRRQREGQAPNPESADPDSSLKPIFEGGEPGNLAAPVYRVSDQGFLPLTTDQYFELVDWSGRKIRSDKQGAIRSDLPPILERLSEGKDFWSNAIENYARGYHRSGREVNIVLHPDSPAASRP